jgi:hypothetical protein
LALNEPGGLSSGGLGFDLKNRFAPLSNLAPVLDASVSFCDFGGFDISWLSRSPKRASTVGLI